MATYRATADWSLTPGEDFTGGRYGRGHALSFGSGQTVRGTASAHVVGNKWSEAGAVDPEEMLVASISTCHMLSYLHAAREAGFTVLRYRDDAEGVMEKNAAGQLWVSKVTLRPEIAFDGAAPSPEQRDHLHHAAHEMCFIANSVQTEVVVEERVAAQ
jgi:organic hydroperoxide reductase OsmC/OhrA